MEAGDGEAAKTRAGADCGTGHELLISNIRVKLKKGTKIFVVPKCNVNSILDGFKVPIKKQICTGKFNWLRSRTVDWNYKYCLGRMWKDNARSKKARKIEMDNRRTLKIVKKTGKRQGLKVIKASLETWTQLYNDWHIKSKRTITTVNVRTQKGTKRNNKRSLWQDSRNKREIQT